MTALARLRFQAAIRDDKPGVLARLTREAGDAQAQAALLMEGQGRPLRIALQHGRRRPAAFIWNRLSQDQRSRALTFHNHLLWSSAARGSRETVTWLLDRTDLTAAAREAGSRPRSAGLIAAMQSAITGGHTATLTALWDRAYWPASGPRSSS